MEYRPRGVTHTCSWLDAGGMECACVTKPWLAGLVVFKVGDHIQFELFVMEVVRRGDCWTVQACGAPQL